MLSPVHPGIPLVFLATRAPCWLMDNLLATGTSKSFSGELLSSRSVCTDACGYSFPGAGLYMCSCRTISSSSPPNSQPARVSLNGSMAFWCVSHFSQLCIICKLAEGALYPFIQVTDEHIGQDQTQYRPIGSTASYRLLAVNPVFNTQEQENLQ